MTKKTIDFEELVRRDPRSVQAVREQINSRRNSKTFFDQSTSTTITKQKALILRSL